MNGLTLKKTPDSIGISLSEQVYFLLNFSRLPRKTGITAKNKKRTHHHRGYFNKLKLAASPSFINQRDVSEL